MNAAQSGGFVANIKTDLFDPGGGIVRNKTRPGRDLSPQRSGGVAFVCSQKIHPNHSPFLAKKVWGDGWVL
jgi:hypothetical protein